MNKTEIIGYHAYRNYGPLPIAHDPLLLAVQALSAISWKRLFGTIHLVCDRNTADSYPDWLLGLYDSIDTEAVCNWDDNPMWWVTAKLAVAEKYLSKHAGAIVDTDLWFVSRPDNLLASNEFTGLHYEDFDEHSNDTPYANPVLFHTDLSLPFDSMPINTALLHCSKPALMSNWVEHARTIISFHQTLPLGGSREAIFVEQRLLAALCKQQDVRVETVLPSIFMTQYPENEVGFESWRMKDEQLHDERLSCLRHLWGMKKELHLPEVRNRLTRQLLEDCETLSVNSKDILEILRK